MLGGSAKALGLVRTEAGESTATVTRHNAGTSGAPLASSPNDDDAGDPDGPATVLKGQKKLAAFPPDDGTADVDADGPATVLKGRIDFPAPAPVAASSDDDDLNETKRADESVSASPASDVEDELDAMVTPVGVKKALRPAPVTSSSGATAIKTPPPAQAATTRATPSPRSTPVPRLTSVPTRPRSTPAPALAPTVPSGSVEAASAPPPSVPPPPPSAPDASAPPSGCTRVAPIAAPTANAAAMAVPVQGWNGGAGQMTAAMPMPAPMPSAGLSALPASTAAGPSTKAVTLPPHKLALFVSMTLMVAALAFVFVRRNQANQAADLAATQAATQTTAVAAETQATQPVAQPAAFPPPAPTFTSQATPTEVKAQPQAGAKAPHGHRATPPRATSRTSIPVHREQ